jgi:hypothetical protein
MAEVTWSDGMMFSEEFREEIAGVVSRDLDGSGASLEEIEAAIQAAVGDVTHSPLLERDILRWRREAYRVV